jgi:hypothetical protein
MVDCFATDSPNPPRVTVLVVAGFGAIAVFGTFMVRPGRCAVALTAGIGVLTVGRAGRVFRAEQRLLLVARPPPIRRPIM